MRRNANASYTERYAQAKKNRTDMKGTLLSLLLILIVLLSGFNCKDQTRKVSATLARTNGNDSTLNSFALSDSSLFDLRVCINKLGYPPNIPQNIYWNQPDTTGLTDIEKQDLVFKYNFDKAGKLTTYYYQGSMISGIFPLPYLFKYGNNNPALIYEINDVFFKSKYRIKYDLAMNIQWIEKLDSIGKRIEILTIEIK